MKRPSVIAIGYGSHLFDSNNVEHKRLRLCAAETTELHQIIFTLKENNLGQTKVTDTLHLHPTNSRNKLLMLYDAIKIACKIIKQSDEEYIVTTQDPFMSGLAGLVLQKLRRVRLVVQEHGDVFGSDHWRKESWLNLVGYMVGRVVLRQADSVRVVAIRVAQHLQSLGIPKEKIVRLPVVIDTSAFAPKVHDVLFDVDSKETFTFLTVARLVEQKNLSLMLRSFHQAWKTNNKIRLLIVGAGTQRQQIESMLSNQYINIESPVTIQGWSDDVPELMRNADSYILSSNYEGWARVLIEAVTSHLPVVTTDVGCVGEVVMDGQHGIVVPVGDQTALTQAIADMASDRNQYQYYLEQLQSQSDIVGTNNIDYGQRWVETLHSR